MRARLIVFALALLIAGNHVAAQQPARQPATSQRPGAAATKAPGGAGGGAGLTQQQKVSYSFGLDIGRTLKMQEVEVDTQALVRGLQDGLTGAAPLLTDEQIQQVMQEFQQEMQSKMADRAKVLGAKNLQEGQQFLAQNKQKAGVIELPSGLQYKVLKQGTGQKPKATDYVQAHYRGTLLDGTEFDSSYQRGEPAKFALNSVIEGWKEALQLMPVGSKWQLYVPAELAYGSQSPSPLIGPNALLIFEVELLDIPQGEELPVR
jgi:FKBP-type peptidyl-prolyl cis-trans isomerase